MNEQEIDDNTIDALIEDKEASISTHLKLTIEGLEISQEEFSIR